MHELPYTFDHIWTNLLTQCTQLPVPVFCCFCILGFPAIKSAPKFWKKYIKNQRHRSFWTHQSGTRGPPPGAQAPWWRGQGGGALGTLLDPWCPIRLYLALAEETPNIDLLFPLSSLYRRRRRFKIGAARRSFPGTLPEGGTPSGRTSITMDASRMCRE